MHPLSVLVEDDMLSNMPPLNDSQSEILALPCGLKVLSISEQHQHAAAVQFLGHVISREKDKGHNPMCNKSSILEDEHAKRPVIILKKVAMLSPTPSCAFHANQLIAEFGRNP